MRIMICSATAWLLIAAVSAAWATAAEEAAAWKAGPATAVITPKDNMWMAGYLARKKPGGYEAQNDYTLDVEERIVGKVREVVRSTAAAMPCEKPATEKPAAEKP